MFDRNYDEILNAISENRSILPEIDDRKFWNGLDKELKDKLVEGAEEHAEFSWPTIPATSFMRYYEDGNRIVNEEIHFEKRHVLLNLTLAECCENEGKYLRNIIDGIWSICEETTWSVSAHIKNGIHTNILPDSTESVFDLFAGETSSCLATVYLLISKRLDIITPIICERLKREVTCRIIDEFLRRNDYWWMGKTNQKVNNWAPWCTSNALFATAVFCFDKEKCAKILKKSLEILDMFVTNYGEDGACDEGPSYWGRAAASLADCLEYIKILTNNKIDYFGLPIVKNMGEYIVHSRLTSDRYMNFADSPSKNIINVASVYSYGKSCGSNRMMADAVSQRKNIIETSNRSSDSTRRMKNLILYNEIMNTTLEVAPQKDIWLPSLQILISREYEKFDCGLVIAVKGGFNDESHNHNDVGSFIVLDNGKPIFIDAGVGVYTAKTFSPERYSIWTMRSLYHNLPFFGSTEQKDGEQYKAKNVSCNIEKIKSTIKMDIAEAYPNGVSQWIREITFDKEKSEIVISEDFILLKEETVGFTFMTHVKPAIKKGSILIHGRMLTWEGFEGKVDSEEIILNDANLEKSYGKSIYRTRIMYNNPVKQGKARFILK